MAAVRAYPSDVKDEEWAFVAPYLCLMREDAPQREYALRYLAPGVTCRMTCRPGPPSTSSGPADGTCAYLSSIVHDLNELQRVLLGREATPTAIVLDGRVVQSTPESGHWAGYNGGKRRKGSTVPIAVDTLGHLLSVAYHAGQ